MSIEKEKIKLITEKCQLILTQLLRDEDNKYCVDCDAKSPRWASWNIGIFLCIRCAGIHRKLGVHISKVKSVNLDSWTPQQVACIEQMGNSRARAVYEANLEDSFRRPQSDSSLEQFIRAKYETKKYIAKEWVPPALPNPNWDAEIERQLKKKKEKKVASGKIEFPAPIKEYSSRPSPKSLPKPDVKNGISKTSSASAALPKPSSNDNSTKSSGMVDLLGLDFHKYSPQETTVTNGSTDTDKDIFGDFLSASEPLSTSADAAAEETKVQNDEANFFSQKAPEAGPEKLSKDSILALYNKAPNQPQPNIPSQFASQPYGNNGMFIRPNASPGVVQHPGGGAAPVVGGQPHMMTHVGAGIQQPNYSSLGSNMGLHMAPHGMPAVPPAPIHFSPANPFAQMQSQMNNMNLGSMPVGGQLPAAAPNPLASVMGYNFLPGNTQTNSSVTANLWQ